MKKLLTVCIAVLMFMFCCGSALAAMIIDIEVDGHSIASDAAPIFQNGRTLVPLRAVGDALGVTVHWQNNEASVRSYDGQLLLRFTPGSKTAVYDKRHTLPQYIELDVSATLRDNRVYVPLRVIAENLGVKTDYQNGKVILTSPRVYLDSKPLALDGKPLTAFVDYKQDNLRGKYATAFYGSVEASNLYRLLAAMPEVDAPAAFGDDPAAAASDYYCYEGTFRLFTETPKGNEDGILNYHYYRRAADVPAEDDPWDYAACLFQSAETGTWYQPDGDTDISEFVRSLVSGGQHARIYKEDI